MKTIRATILRAFDPTGFGKGGGSDQDPRYAQLLSLLEKSKRIESAEIEERDDEFLGARTGTFISVHTRKGDILSLHIEDDEWLAFIQGQKRDIEWNLGNADDLQSVVQFVTRGITKRWYAENDPDWDRY